MICIILANRKDRLQFLPMPSGRVSLQKMMNVTTNKNNMIKPTASGLLQSTVQKNKVGKFTFIDLFAGIGGFRIPLEELGGINVGFSEIDRTAIETYKKNFDVTEEENLGDIANIIDYPYADVITGGVPCQSWSVAGKKHGFEDPRGALWFNTIEFVKNVKPKAFIFENVKGLADPRNKENLSLIIESLEKIDYKVYYKVLNAFDFGLPQNRERIFIVGIKKEIKKDFVFPNGYEVLPNISDILEVEKVSLRKSVENHSDIKNSFNMSYKINKENYFTFCDTRNGDHSIHSWDIVSTTQNEKDICIAVMKNRRKKKYGTKDGNSLSFHDIQDIIPNLSENDLSSLITKKILNCKNGKYEFVNSKNSSGIFGVYRIFTPSSHVFSTLTKTGVRDFVSTIDVPSNVKNKKEYFIENIYKKKLYRKLSVREAARVQGFPDTYSFPENYGKSLGLLGNALGVNIVREVAKNLLKVI
jgi:DNA (cytosine-5)-methyltransferase 1